jgi:hypothetical protein
MRKRKRWMVPPRPAYRATDCAHDIARLRRITDFIEAILYSSQRVL